jgi:hypothetical protein
LVADTSSIYWDAMMDTSSTPILDASALASNQKV